MLCIYINDYSMIAMDSLMFQFTLPNLMSSMYLKAVPPENATQ